MDGAPALAAEGGQLSAATVVIQYTIVRTSRFLEEDVPPPYAQSNGFGHRRCAARGQGLRRALVAAPGRRRHDLHDRVGRADDLRQGAGLGGSHGRARIHNLMKLFGFPRRSVTSRHQRTA
jgi:hypothetical protein